MPRPRLPSPPMQRQASSRPHPHLKPGGVPGILVADALIANPFPNLKSLLQARTSCGGPVFVCDGCHSHGAFQLAPLHIPIAYPEFWTAAAGHILATRHAPARYRLDVMMGQSTEVISIDRAFQHNEIPAAQHRSKII